MKVCFYFGVFARIGGIEEFTKDLALALLAAGADVRVVCASLGHHPILDELRGAGASVCKVPVYHGCSWNIPDYALLPFALSQIKNTDVVIHQKPLRPSFYPLLSRKPKHVYLTSYSPGEQFGREPNARRFFEFFDAIFTQVDSFREELRTQGVKCPIHVLPLIPPMALPLSSESHPSGKLRIAMMGRLEPQKNPLYALELANALACNLPEGHNEAEFHIYGDGSLLPSLKKRAELLSIRTIFHGAYGRGEVADIVSGNDMFLITSISEGQCIVALEILSGGRPLFATPVGALPSVLGKTERGCVLPETNAQAGADVIRQWWRGRHHVSASQIQQSYQLDYDADVIKRKYVDHIKDIAQRK